MKKKIIYYSLLFLVLLGIVVVCIFFYVSKSKSSKSITSDNSNNNTATTVDNTNVGPGFLRDDVVRSENTFEGSASRDYIESRFKGRPLDKFKFKLANDLIPFDALSFWDPPTTPFISIVKYIDRENSQVTLQFTGPEDMPLLETEDSVKLDCDKNDTHFSDATTRTSYVPDIYSVMSVGDVFIGFCDNEACASVTGFCKVIQDKKDATN